MKKVVTSFGHNTGKEVPYVDFVPLWEDSPTVDKPEDRTKLVKKIHKNTKRKIKDVEADAESLW